MPIKCVPPTFIFNEFRVSCVDTVLVNVGQLVEKDLYGVRVPMR
jgi:hypothetical protein